MTCLCLDIKEGEILQINGAIITFDKRTRLRLHNRVAFLLERQTIKEEDATTPLRRAYLAIQKAYMETDIVERLVLNGIAIKALRGTITQTPDATFYRAAALAHIEEARHYRALADLRKAIEADELIASRTMPIVEPVALAEAMV